jgi:predicted nucleotidyltransferase
MAMTTPVQCLDQVVLSWPSQSTRLAARELVQELCHAKSILAVVVFGSAVRGAYETFDLDILYVYRDRRPSFRRPSMDIDLRGYLEVETTQLLSSGHDLICWAVKFGRSVCEREHFWATLVSKWSPRLQLPSITAAMDRASHAHAILMDLEATGDHDAALEQLVTYLTHMARVRLIEASTYPASRPELPEQLRELGVTDLAGDLESALRLRSEAAGRSTSVRRDDILEMRRLSSAGSKSA